MLIAAPVSAQSLKLPSTVFLASAAADWSSTAYCFTKPGCTERNPLLNWAKPLGAPTMISIGAAADLGSLYLVHRFVSPKHPKWARAGLYAMSAVRVAVAVSNVRDVRRQSQAAPIMAGCGTGCWFPER